MTDPINIRERMEAGLCGLHPDDCSAYRDVKTMPKPLAEFYSRVVRILDIKNPPPIILVRDDVWQLGKLGMAGTKGFSSYDAKAVFLPDSIVAQLEKHDPAAEFLVAHEMGHLQDDKALMLSRRAAIARAAGALTGAALGGWGASHIPPTDTDATAAARNVVAGAVLSTLPTSRLFSYPFKRAVGLYSKEAEAIANRCAVKVVGLETCLKVHIAEVRETAIGMEKWAPGQFYKELGDVEHLRSGVIERLKKALPESLHNVLDMQEVVDGFLLYESERLNAEASSKISRTNPSHPSNYPTPLESLEAMCAPEKAQTKGWGR